MIEKISKSNSTIANIEEKTIIEELKSKVAALTSECNYWKTRHSLLEKYGTKNELEKVREI